MPSYSPSVCLTQGSVIQLSEAADIVLGPPKQRPRCNVSPEGSSHEMDLKINWKVMNRRYMCTYENDGWSGGELREVCLLHNRKTRTAGVITGGNSSYCLVLLMPYFPMHNAVPFKGPPSCEQPVVRLPTAEKSTVIIQNYGSVYRNPALVLMVSDRNIDRFYVVYIVYCATLIAV